MIRAITAAMLLFSSCAHAPEPKIDPNAALLALLTAQRSYDSGECPEFIKIEGEIRDPSQFLHEMELCKDRAVLIEINSPGGSVFAALEMQKAIERHPHPVVCMVDGMAASAAFVTLQSCDMRTMTDRSMLMAHHASLGGVDGMEEDVQNAAEVLRVLDRAMALRCAKRMNMDPDDFEAHVTGGKEWWLGLESATAFHAIDFEVSGLDEALILISSP